MKGTYLVAAAIGVTWLAIWIHHKLCARLPVDEITGAMVVQALSRSPRWAAVQNGLDWSSRWQEARTTNIVKIKPKGKTVKAGRFTT
jgi:hypothetical protein